MHIVVVHSDDIAGKSDREVLLTDYAVMPIGCEAKKSVLWAHCEGML